MEGLGQGTHGLRGVHPPSPSPADAYAFSAEDPKNEIRSWRRGPRSGVVAAAREREP